MLLLHCSEPAGHMYPGKGTATPDLIYPFLEANPALVTICAHWGGGLPFYTLMPEVKKALKNVFFDTSASSLLYDKQVYSTAINLIGADKILYGSDFPLVEQGSSLKEIASLKLPPQAEKQILGGNAAKLLGIEER